MCQTETHKEIEWTRTPAGKTNRQPCPGNAIGTVCKTFISHSVTPRLIARAQMRAPYQRVDTFKLGNKIFHLVEVKFLYLLIKI